MSTPISSIFSTAMASFETGDYAQSFHLLQQGAANGDKDCYANLAVLYDTGLGTAKNPKLALIWYKRAWRHEPSSGICANIASLYAELGNIRQAKFWWKKAIVQFQDGDAALDFAKFLIRYHYPTNQRTIRQLLHLTTQYDYTTEFAKREAQKIIYLINKHS